MSFLQENKAVSGLLALGGLVFLGGAGWAVYNHLSLSDAKSKFAAAEKAYAKLATETKPSPEKANTEQLRETLAKAKDVHAKQIGILFGGHANLTERAPTTSEETLFALKSFLTKQDQLFMAAGFPVDQAASFFGFEHYIAVKKDGPGLPADIAKVHIQRQVIERLLGHLLSAGKRDLSTHKPEIVQLKSVRRTRVESGSEGKDIGGVVKGIFNIAPEVTARVPNVVDTFGVELVFIGKTETLRRLVNSVVADQLPWVIRSVEVKRFQGEPNGEAPPPLGVGFTDVIRDTYSQFTLTLVVVSQAQPVSPAPEGQPAPTPSK